MLFTFEEFKGIYEFSENTNPIRVRGSEKVFAGRNKVTNKQVAIKTSIENIDCLFQIGNDDKSMVTNMNHFLNKFRQIWNEWAIMLLAQATHSVKVESFSLKISEGPLTEDIIRKKKTRTISLTPYIAMDLLSKSLEDVHLKPLNPLKKDQFEGLCKVILDILCSFEEVGVAHRNIKPSTLMYKEEMDVNSIRLVGFNDGMPITTGKIIPTMPSGTLLYCHPELDDFINETKEIDNIDLLRRNDKFCCGMTLLHLAGASHEDLKAIKLEGYKYNVKRGGNALESVAKQIKIESLEFELIQNLLEGNRSCSDIASIWRSKRASLENSVTKRVQRQEE